MATPTLPYPDMDFTPLDILTAEEMNQMVANDEYLSNFCKGLADGSNLSDGMILTCAKKMFPVGSIYISTSSANPSSFLGGTWERFAKGQTLVGVNESETEFATVEKTGGAKTITLTLDQMPKHNHSIRWGVSDGGTSDSFKAGQNKSGDTAGHNIANEQIGLQGGGQPHNNLQPYITVYFWKRTA